MAATEIFATNRAVTTVSSGGTDAPAGGTQETWTVASSAGFGAAATGVSQFHVTDPAAASEVIAVTNVTGTTWTVTRGAEGTTPVAHSAGFAVYQVTTAGFLGSVLQFSGGTLAGPVSNTSLNEWNLDSFTGTDDQKMTAALAQVISGGGGTIKLAARSHSFAAQWATTYTPGARYPIRISGTGGPPHGLSEGTPSGSTTCAMSYAGSGVARMDFQHAGSIEIEHILFTDSGGSAVPFFQTTNAQPYLHDCGFLGSATGTACFQDAIYMGGTGTVTYAGDTAPFQAYVGVVERCSFFGIRTAGWARTFANNVIFRDCLISNTCGAPNVFSVTDGAMTAASATLTCSPSAPFTSGMVGQPVLVSGAGGPYGNGWLAAVITAYTSATQVTLSVAAITTVTGSTVTAPSAAPFILGLPGNGVEGCVIDGGCIETTGYAVGMILQSSVGNAVLGTSFWDGTVGLSVAGAMCVNNSKYNFFEIPQFNMPAGSAQVLADHYPSQQAVFAMTDNNVGNGVFVPNLLVDGGALRVIGTGATTGPRLGFGPVGGADDTWVYRDGAGNLALNLGFGTGSPYYDMRYSTLGARIGNVANYAYAGPLGTVDAWFAAGGNNANIHLNLRAQGTSVIRVNSKLTSVFAGTPAVAANAAAGTGATVSVAGNDQRGTITLTTGTGPTAGDQLTLTFTTTGGTYPSAPVAVVCGQGTAVSAALEPYVVSASTATFHLGVAVAPSASTAYTFNYVCMG